MQPSANTCSYCGYDNRRGILFCEECAYPLTNGTNETIRGNEISDLIRQVSASGKLETGETERFEREARLLLHIRNEAEPLVIRVGANQMKVGRHDSKNNRSVDIDLTPFGGLKKGVSRLHAILFRDENNTLFLQDVDSVNGTYLNGNRLPPREAFPVNNGDEITFGNLQVHAYFENPAITPTIS